MKRYEITGFNDILWIISSDVPLEELRGMILEGYKIKELKKGAEDE